MLLQYIVYAYLKTHFSVCISIYIYTVNITVSPFITWMKATYKQEY